jgi:histidinol phosphatase-like enzyme (inositol monophosphatase family)
MKSVPEQFVETAVTAADLARQITRRYFRAPLEITSKQDLSPVTIADRETEQVVSELIFSRHPDHSFFGEETGKIDNGGDWRWILDPIDGTKAFATGKPTFGTLIALLYRDHPVLGIIDHGMLNERWVGVQGKPTTHNGGICTTSKVDTLESSSIYATTLDMFNEDTLAQYRHLSGACQFRVFGGDCYSYGLLSSGHTEIICEADLYPYDYMALVPVIEGAGGVITDWTGAPPALESSGEILASANETLHQLALDRLNSRP